MLDIGWSELLVVAVVAIIVVGPKDLPRMMRTFGHYAGKLRRAASDFQRQFSEAMAESEAEEVRKNIESIRSGLGPADLKAGLDRPVMMPTPAPHSIERAIEPGPKAPRKAARRKTKRPAKSAAKATAARRKTKAKTTAKPKTKATTKARRKP